MRFYFTTGCTCAVLPGCWNMIRMALSSAASGRAWNCRPRHLATLAVGSGSGQPELYITTEGEGLVILDDSGLRQVRPVEPRYRKLTSVLPLSTGQVLLGTEKDGIIVYDGEQDQSFQPFPARN